MSVTETEKQDLQPLPYSLSSLQIEAGKKYNFSPHKFLSTKILISFADEKFSVTGKNILEVGWKSLFQNSDEKDLQTLPKISENDSVEFSDAKILDKVTKPPSHFTPSTLLQAMKEIFKFVRDENLKQNLKDCSGIGTEATRAGIIEKLQSQDFLKLDKKNLLPTEKAIQAMKILPPEITFPDLTAIWENQLEDVKNGKIFLETFLQQQISDLKNFVEQVKISAEKLPPTFSSKNKISTCPKCGENLIQWKFFCFCMNYFY